MRVDALFDKGIWDSFLKFYFYGSDTVIPPLTWETFWGLGILSGTSGSGITINADGAFIKMYAAVGPLLTIAFYICLFQTCDEAFTVLMTNNCSAWGGYLCGLW